MKKVGIVVDNYKLKKFQAALTKAGFVYDTKDFTPGTTAIFLNVFDNELDEIKKICATLQINFHQSN